MLAREASAATSGVELRVEGEEVEPLGDAIDSGCDGGTASSAAAAGKPRFRVECGDGAVMVADTLGPNGNDGRGDTSTVIGTVASPAGGAGAPVALWETRWVARDWRLAPVVDTGGGGGGVRLELARPLAFWLNPYGRRWRVDPPPVPRPTAGGILADEMVSCK